MPRTSQPSSGAAASTPPSGASPSCSTGCATIRRSARVSPRRWNTATWWPPCFAASPTPPPFRAASAPWATSGCGTRGWAASLRKNSWRVWTRCSPACAPNSPADTPRPTRSRGISIRHGLPNSACAPASPFRLAFDAHWDAIGAGVSLGDVVNVVGTSTCIIAISQKPGLIPGVCGVVQGSVDPQCTGIEAGLSATGDILEAIARRAATTVAELSRGLENYRAGETGLLRLTWDNGDRTVLVNSELSGVTLGWRLTTTAQDELFAAIEGTAFHTRVILERMEQHGVPVHRIINSGGIPQKNSVLNQVYANVMGKPILVPKGDVTSLGSAIFAFMAAGTLRTIAEAQDALVPGYATIEPDASAAATYQGMYSLYKNLYFALGERQSPAVAIGNILPELRSIAARAREGTRAGSVAS